MKFLGIYLLLGGYILVYASVANGGKFATDPWNGVFGDAYPPSNVGSAVSKAAAGASGVLGL